MTGQDDGREQQGRLAKWPSVERWSVGAWVVAVLLLVLCSGAVELASTAANLELR